VTKDKDNSDTDEVHPDQVGKRTDSDPTPEQWSILKNYFITQELKKILITLFWI
jgi:hypothetical protein